MNKSTIVVSCGSHVTKRSLQFIHKDFTLKEKTYHLNLLKDLISWMVYRPRAKFISGPGNISQVFSPRVTTPRPRIVFKFFPRYQADIGHPNFPC